VVGGEVGYKGDECGRIKLANFLAPERSPPKEGQTQVSIFVDGNGARKKGDGLSKRGEKM